MTIVRAAMTQTANVYAPMPESVDDLGSLAGKLEDMRKANVEHHVSLIEQAQKLGAQIIGLGELFPAPYFALRRDEFWREMAEDARDGPTATRLREVASRLNMVISAPIYERVGEKRFNTAIVIDSGGSILGSFRKCHIPHGSNEAGSFKEACYYERSDGAMEQDADRVDSKDPYLPVFSTSIGIIGVAICYDRHFEGMISGLVSRGAQMIFSPAVTFGEKSRRMWEMEFEVDAARHNVFIGGSNRLGTEQPWNQEFFGASYFTGPNGRCKNLSDDEHLIVADLDLSELSSPDPSGWDLKRDARPEIKR